MAYEGQYQEAAKLYAKSGMVDKAVDMFSDLRLWDEAKLFAQRHQDISTQGLMEKQATWLKETGEWQSAAKILVANGNYMEAVELFAENGDVEGVIEISQRVAPEDKEVLRRCGEILTQVERFDAAKEVYKKVGDNEGLLK
ncbi:ift122, partial [Symbiodinium sp. KB8]